VSVADIARRSSLVAVGGAGAGDLQAGEQGGEMSEETEVRLETLEKTLKDTEKENRALKDRIARLEKNEDRFLHTYMPAFGLLFTILQYLLPTLLRLMGLM
jgi:hypothetical protein